MDLAMVAPAGETHTAQPGRAGEGRPAPAQSPPGPEPRLSPRSDSPGPAPPPCPARPSPARGWARMASDGAGWPRMVPDAGAALTGAALAAATGPEEREHRGGCRESGSGRAGTPSPVVPPGSLPVVFPHRRSLPTPPRLPRPPLPPRGGPEAAAAPAPGGPRRGRARSPQRCGGPRSLGDAVPPTNTFPTNTVPPLTCPPTMASAGPARGAESRGRPARGPARPPGSLRPSAPSESGRGLSARSTTLGQYGHAQAMLPMAGSFSAVHLYLYGAPEAANGSVCFQTFGSFGCATSVTPKTPLCPAKTWHGAGVCAVSDHAGHAARLKVHPCKRYTPRLRYFMM